MESSFRAYRKLHLSRSWDWFIPTYYPHLYRESGSLMGHTPRRRPFGAQDKYFLSPWSVSTKCTQPRSQDSLSFRDKFLPARPRCETEILIFLDGGQIWQLISWRSRGIYTRREAPRDILLSPGLKCERFHDIR